MNNTEQDFEFLDVINVVSFMAQLQNMEEDEKQTTYINKIIHVIFDEIQKLHQENNLIIEKLDLLLKEKEKEK